jgi:hypothetical protein
MTGYDVRELAQIEREAGGRPGAAECLAEINAGAGALLTKFCSVGLICQQRKFVARAFTRPSAERVTFSCLCKRK